MQPHAPISLLVEGTCRCGWPLDRTEQLPEPVDQLSLARLVELALAAADSARCLCGAWRGRHGQASACVQIPGGPWVIATVLLSDRSKINLNARPDMPGRHLPGPTLHQLNADELDTAQRLGAPLSVRGAWRKALLLHELSQEEIGFPCGDGLRCTVIAGGGSSRSEHRTLDLILISQLNDEPWLGEEDLDKVSAGAVRCLIEVGEDAIHQALQREADNAGLLVQARSGERARLRHKGGTFTVEIDERELLYSTVGHGRLPRAELRHLVTQAAERLTRLEQARTELVDVIKPLSARPLAPGSAELVLDTRRGSCFVDMDLLSKLPWPARGARISELSEAIQP